MPEELSQKTNGLKNVEGIGPEEDNEQRAVEQNGEKREWEGVVGIKRRRNVKVSRVPEGSRNVAHDCSDCIALRSDQSTSWSITA